jgi:hypothetical protein
MISVTGNNDADTVAMARELTPTPTVKCLDIIERTPTTAILLNLGIMD